MSHITAWMSRHDNHIVTFDRELVKEAEDAGVDNWIPLYTHPVKQLSDKEILKNWTWKYTSCHEDNLIAFARAIIKEITE